MADNDEYKRDPFELPDYWKKNIEAHAAAKPKPATGNDGDGDTAPVKVLKPDEPKVVKPVEEAFAFSAPPPPPPPPEKKKSKEQDLGFSR